MNVKATTTRIFLSGISAVCAQLFVQPIELLKVRLQNNNKYLSMSQMFAKIIKKEGYCALWKGMIPSALRELTYSSMRFGLYAPLKTWMCNTNETIFIKLLAGGIAGGFGAAIATPFDLLKCQSQASVKPVKQRKLIKRAYNNGGMRGMWRGCATTVNRAILLGSVKLTSYDEIKGALVKHGWDENSMACICTASVLTGLIVTCAIAPIDFARTRYMSSQISNGHTYKSGLDVLLNENPLRWYKGFVPLWLRLGPYAVIHFVIWENLCSWAKIKTV